MMYFSLIMIFFVKKKESRILKWFLKKLAQKYSKSIWRSSCFASKTFSFTNFFYFYSYFHEKPRGIKSICPLTFQRFSFSKRTLWVIKVSSENLTWKKPPPSSSNPQFLSLENPPQHLLHHSLTNLPCWIFPSPYDPIPSRNLNKTPFKSHQPSNSYSQLFSPSIRLPLPANPQTPLSQTQQPPNRQIINSSILFLSLIDLAYRN